MYSPPPSPAPSSIPMPSSPINTDRTPLARGRSTASIDTLVDTIDTDAEGVTLTRSNRSNRTFGPSLSDMEDAWGLTPVDDGEPDVPLERMFWVLPTPSMSDDASMYSVDDLVTPVDAPSRVFRCSECVQTLTQKDGKEQAPAFFMCSAYGCDAKYCSACAVSRFTGKATGCSSCGGPGLPIMANQPTGTASTSTSAQQGLQLSFWSKILETTIERFRATSEYRTTGRLGCLAFYLWIGKAYAADGREFPLAYETLQAAWEEAFGDYGPPSRGAENVEAKLEDGLPSRDEEDLDPRLDSYATFENIFLRVEALYEGMHALSCHPQGSLILAQIQIMTGPKSGPSLMAPDERERFEHDLLEIMFNHCIHARRIFSKFRKEGVLHPSAVPQGANVRFGAPLHELMHALASLPPDFNAFNYMFPESDNAVPGSPLKPTRVRDKDSTPRKTRLAELRDKELASKELSGKDENLTPRDKDLFRMFDEWAATSLADEPPQHAGLSRWSQNPGADVFGSTSQGVNNGQNGFNAPPDAQFWQSNSFMPQAAPEPGVPVSALQQGDEHSEEWYVQMSKVIKELVDAPPPADAASGQSSRVPSMKAPWSAVRGIEQAQEKQDVFRGMLGEDEAWLKNKEVQGGHQVQDSGVPVEDTGINPFITQQPHVNHNNEQPLMPALQPPPQLSPHTQSTIPAHTIHCHDVGHQFPTYYQYVPEPLTVGFSSREVRLVDDPEPPKTPTRRSNLANSTSRTQSMAHLVGPTPHVPKPRTPSSNHQTPRKARSTSSMHLPDEKARTPRRTLTKAIAVLSPRKTNGGGGDPMESPAKRKFMELWRIKGSRPGTPNGPAMPINHSEGAGAGNKENRSPMEGQRSQLFKKPSFLFGNGEGLGSPSRRGERV